MPSAFDALVELLDLERIEQNLFRGRQPNEKRQRVFGGHVAGQALIAAGRTVEDRSVHSLHAYFLRPGDPQVPIIYQVERTRDGRSFATRRVTAIQHGRPIESRHVELMDYFGGRQEPRSNIWIRAKGRLPDEPLLHRCVVAYASDMTLIDTAARPHPIELLSDETENASLDHAMWFHRPFRADEWLLYSQESPTMSGSRGLTTGHFFRRDGTLVASVVQEGLFRIRRRD